MIGYEYKVIPAPAKGRKAPGIKGAEARFAHALEHRINELAAEGWEYLRADILPSEERQGLTSTQTVYRSVLVFQRAAGVGAAEQEEPTAGEALAETTENEEPAPEHPSEELDETDGGTDDEVPQDPPEEETKKEVSS